MIAKGNENDAARNAITDFLHTGGKLVTNDTVFSVHINNVGDKIVVRLRGASDFKVAPNSKNKIGTSYAFFPTMYLEHDHKLFYWYDSTHTITKDLIGVLSKYKHIDSLNVNGFVGIPDSSPGNDGYKKPVYYYFCKCNLRKYKKIVTGALGHYNSPELGCDCK
jgi:hypothetical protein